MWRDLAFWWKVGKSILRCGKTFGKLFMKMWKQDNVPNELVALGQEVKKQAF